MLNELVSEEIEPEGSWEAEDLLAAATKAVDIWWAVPHTLNKWISGAVPVPDDSADFAARLALTEKPLASAHSEDSVRLRRFVPKAPDGPFAADGGEFCFCRQWDGGLEATFAPVPELGSELRHPGPASRYVVAFRLHFESEKARVRFTLSTASEEEAEHGWLRETLTPKLLSWFRGSLGTASTAVRTSLGLVSLGRYTELYAGLKRRHGRRLVSSWPERTDPQKFVYEDIATAAYLIALWEAMDPSFGRRKAEEVWCIDVGCGNGLLCHVLALEGVKCLGVDLRSRKIWDFYGPETDLKAESIDPSSKDITLPPTRWLIGNHSDELTPWISILAARMSCHYFILPCCPWDFYGKFSRRRENLSQYASYLAFLVELGGRLGFKVSEDRLKIPSTKRLCQVGLWESPSDAESRIVSELGVAAAIVRQQGAADARPAFLPRPAVESVRNCTQLPRNLVATLVERFGWALLPTAASDEWSRSLGLAEAAALLSAEERIQLKAQCGGLQTLLKNNGQVFVVKGGCVELRRPKRLKEGGVRRSACWFHGHYPTGCPNEAADCAYRHEHSDPPFT